MEEQQVSNDNFLKEKGNYIMIVRRGGAITDVWKLEGATPRYNKTANGWVVVSANNPTFFVGGDVEIWSIKAENAQLWQKYKTYHELDEKFTQPIPVVEAPPPPKPFWRWPVIFQNPVKWNW